MDFGTLKATVARRLSESASSPVFWSDEDVARAVNNGYLEISDSSEFFERFHIVPLLSDRTYFDMRTVAAEGWLVPTRIWSDASGRWAQPTDARTLDAQFGFRWERASGSPRYVFTRGLWWLGVHPRSNSEAQSLRIYGACLPPRLVEDSDEPLIDEEFHEGIVHYALYELFVQDRETILALRRWKEYLDYEKRWSEVVAQRIATDRVWTFVDQLPGEEVTR